MRKIIILLFLVSSTAYANDFKTADKKLNALYKSYIEKISNDKIALNYFKKSQLAWLKFRDAHCDYQSNDFDNRFGTILPTIKAYCLEGVTNDRNSQLEYLNSCTEGDLSCPVF